ncbi:MAG TPA: (Fe-S)-binding protein [Desulfosporosinus sp.]|nr:(Fe-S)-binding protein [Desulfosporosinus sp.]
MQLNLETSTHKIIAECAECGLCSGACNFLAQTGVSPLEMAHRGITFEEAYGCAQCGMCEVICPLHLNPMQMFVDRRVEAVRNAELDPNDFNYFLPDCEENVMKLYRRYYEVDYSDITIDLDSRTCFFPGCTLMTYSPGLTKKIYSQIQLKYGCQGMLTSCCGKPLYQMGLIDRAEKYLETIIKEVKQRGIQRLVVSCPSCYYLLRDLLKGTGVEILTVYEMLDFKKDSPESLPQCTVHDPCPDRGEGIFAQQVRGALESFGYELVEMSNNRENTLCCGSGGQISHFRPELACNLVESRLSEASSTGAAILASSCLSCVLNFARKPSELSIRHALNLLLDYDEDYTETKNKAAQMFAEQDEVQD